MYYKPGFTPASRSVHPIYIGPPIPPSSLIKFKQAMDRRQQLLRELRLMDQILVPHLNPMQHL